MKRISGALIGGLLCAASVSAFAGGRQADPPANPSLFAPLPSALRPSVTEVASLEPQVKRFSHVAVRFDLLDRAAADRARATEQKGEGLPAFRLNLFKDKTLVAKAKKIEFGDDGKSVIWIGEIEGQPLSSFTIAVTDDVMSGNFRTLDGAAYQLRYVSPGVFAIRDVDLNKLPPESEPIVVPQEEVAAAHTRSMSVGATTAADPVVAADDSGAIIDVMVAYTPAAQTAAGGASAITNLTVLAISETNQGYANSGVVQRVRLVRVEPVAYVENTSGPGAFDNALSALQNPADGVMDSLHTSRNTYGADMVSLWIQDNSSCGLGYLMTTESHAFESLAFSVVTQGCATGNYSFGHEMGHNQGSHHDRFVTGGDTGVKPYSFGYVQKAASPVFRTIMAYANDCGSCARLNYWSSPLVSVSGFPTGIAAPAANSADNARSMNDVHVTVANWRTTVVPVPTFSINDVSLAEGNSGVTNANFTVSLSAPALNNVSVNYATANGTAIGTPTFSSPAPIAINTSGNAAPYPSTIAVSGVSAVSKVTVALNGFTHTYPRDVDILLVGPTGQAVILMSDAGGTAPSPTVNLTFDDAAATAISTSAFTTGTFRPANIADGEGGDAFPSAPAGPWSTSLASFNGLAANGNWSLYVVDDSTGDGGQIGGGWSISFQSVGVSTDYDPVSGTLTFAPGETSKQIAVSVRGDTTPESNETFFVNLSNAVPANIADAQGIGTITNDDVSSFLTIADASKAEGNAGTSNLTFTATLSPASASTVMVNWATSNLTATAPSDYIAASGTLTFAPGVTTQTLNVSIVGDVNVEDNDTFQVTLSAPTNATISDAIAIGTIVNDDLASRIFVASSGSDANSCSIQTSPCRNIAAAIAQVQVDGEVIILSPGEYESAPLLINKSVKVTAPTGTVAFIRQPITVTASGGRVVLRGLSLKGTGTGTAVSFTDGSMLSIEDTTIDGWNNGLMVSNGATPPVIALTGVVLRANTTALALMGNPLSRIAIDDARIERNTTGVSLTSGALLMRDTALVGNTGVALSVGLGSSAVVQRSEFVFNGTGMSVLAAGTGSIARSRVIGNGLGLNAAGGSTFYAYGTNVLRRNTTDKAGTITTVPEQ